jgi:hypothetical protein
MCRMAWWGMSEARMRLAAVDERVRVDPHAGALSRAVATGGLLPCTMGRFGLVLVNLCGAGWHTAVAQRPRGRTVFVIAQMDSRATVNVVAGFSSFRALVLAGVEDKMSTGYRELNSVVGLRWASRQSVLLVAAKVGRRTDGWYEGVVVAPSMEPWHLVAGGSVLIFTPLQRGAPAGYQVKPARLLAQPMSRCRVGVSYTRLHLAGSPAQQAVGPALQFVGRGWDLTLDDALATEHTARLVTVIWRVRW